MEPNSAIYLRHAIFEALDTLAALHAEATLAFGLVLALILSLLPGQRARMLLPLWITLTLFTALAQLFFLDAPAQESQMLRDSMAARWTQGLCLISTLLLLPSFARDKRLQSEPDQQGGERYVLLLGLLLGAFLLIRAKQVMIAYLGLELISIASYVLIGFTRREPRSAEASLKFFLYGAFASGFFLYGSSWLYGLTQTLSLEEGAFRAGLEAAGQGLWLLPMGLMLIGLLFKLAAFPLHFWMPDAWEAGTYPVAGLLAVVPKVATTFFLLNLFEVLPQEGTLSLRWMTGILAVVSMTWGNLAALRQVHMRRLLAYSGVAHAGFLLMALAIHSPAGNRAGLFYLTVYALMNPAMFLMAEGFHRGLGHARWQEWEGRGRLFPWGTAALAVILASLTGLPPTAGFIAKWMLFLSALEQADSLSWMLVGVGTLNTVLALAYYLIIPSRMVFRPSPSGDKRAEEFPRYEMVAGLGLAGLLLVGGIWGFDKILSLMTAWW